MSPRGKRVSPFRILLRVVLLLLLVYGVVLGVSANKIYGTYQHAMEEYDAYEKAMDEIDIEAAMASVHSMATDIAIMENESNMWQWELASHVPVLGEDVSCAQQLISIADRLANKALLPTLEAAEDALGDLSKVGEVVDALMHARTVVKTCNDYVNKLPTSHFDGLNEVTSKVKEIINTVNETFDNLSIVLDVANILT